MAKIQFGNEIQIPDDLALVAQETGIGILDVGYLCSDSRPFFRFGEMYYTNINPIHATSALSVAVFTYNYTKQRMQQTNYGTQTGSTLVLSTGGTYQYTDYIMEERVYMINKWAKDKPLNIDQNDTLTETQKANLNRGLSVASYTTLGPLITAVKAAIDADSLWTYTTPPVHNYRKRLRDFDGYNHMATNPFRYELDYRKAWKGDHVKIKQKQGTDNNVDNIQQSDLSFMAGKYIGVAFRKQNDSTALRAVTMPSGATEIDISISESTLPFGTWEMAMIASSVQITNITMLPTGAVEYIPLPCMYDELTVEQGTGVTYTASWASILGTGSSRTLNFTLSLNRQRNMTTNYLNIVYTPNDGGTPIQQAFSSVSTIPVSGLNVSLAIGNYADDWRLKGTLTCQYTAAGYGVEDDLTLVIPEKNPGQLG